MQTVINIGYNDLEFTESEIEELKRFIENQLKDSERFLGVGFLYKEISFRLNSIFYNISESQKIITIQQITTKKNPIIQKPKLELINHG